MVEALFVRPSMNRHTLYYNLRDAFTEEGCPLCRLCSRAVDRYLEHLLYESVNDPRIRRNIRLSQGFCKEHAWQLQQKGDALGIAIVYHDVMVNILRALGREGGYGAHPSPTQRLRRLLPEVASQAARRLAERLAPTRRCTACLQGAEVERAYLETLLQHCADRELLALWRTSDGLCWPHLQHGLRLARDEATLRRLIDVELPHLEHLRDELSEFIRRHDYRLGGKGFGSEGDSWIRAVAKISGWRDRSPG
jgi:hypothetical protein